MNKKILIMGIAAFALAFFWLRALKKGNSFHQAVKNVLTHSSPPPSAAVEKSPIPQGSEKVMQKRFNRLLASNILPLPFEESSRQLRVKVLLEARGCSMGDFDVMKGASKHFEAKNFLLELAAVDGSDVFWSQGLSIFDLTQGKEFLAKLPKGPSRLSSFYICNSERGKKTCVGKKLVDYLAPAISPGALRNRIFYSQYLMEDDNGLFLIPSTSWDEKVMRSIESNFNGGYGLDKKQFGRFRNEIYRLRSSPSRIAGKTLELVLAYREPRCSP